MREEIWGRADSVDEMGDRDPNDRVDEILRFVGGERFRTFLANILDAQESTLGRVSVNRYRRGHFTGIREGAASRSVAHFRFDFTPNWVSDWGGIIDVYDFCGRVEHTYVPLFNSLIVLGPTTKSSLGVVAPFAARSQYTIEGMVPVF
jgi:Rps23 Pro-64 3,4-dihydroxylase Tpa1-like proline 4-hydroxylase